MDTKRTPKEKEMNFLRYGAGVMVLFWVGLSGGNIFLTSIEIGIAYTILDYFDQRFPPTRPS